VSERPLTHPDGLPVDADEASPPVTEPVSEPQMEPAADAGAEPESTLEPEPTPEPEPESADTLEPEAPQVEAAEDTAQVPGDAEALERLTHGLEALDARLEESQRLQARQAEFADRLHEENRTLREGELRNAQLPLVRELLRLHDDISRLLDVATPEATPDLEIVRDGLLDALSHHGIEAIDPAPGTVFDPRQHSAAGTVATEDPARDRTVAETVRSGFRWADEKPIRAVEVRVHKHAPQKAPDEMPATTEGEMTTE
jgi:molecular chaperone GrpE (heat shock protein)